MTHSRATQLGLAAYGDVLTAFTSLSVERREALILIEAAGLSYKAAARVCRRPS